MLYGYRAWIRTMNNASKGRCVTVTPRGKKERATQYPQKIDTRKLTRKVHRQKATFRQEKSPGTSGRGLTRNVGFQCRNTLWILAKPKSFENQE
jgi:hypothetical protein